ncbi:MAG: hypothetical protein RLY30_1844, partial [Pseudomonadota bacterium]
RRTLSVLMICKNEADRIEASLGSVAQWADEIVVLDSGSTDGTADIARRYTDKVWVTDWPGYGAQRNRALDRCSCEWVLSLDADEVLTDNLKAQIDVALSDPALTATVIKFPWRTYLFGRPILRGRYSSPQAKLFIREGTRYRDHLVHESLLMPVRKELRLSGYLDHYSWRDYQHLQSKHLQYAHLLAVQKHAKASRGSLVFATFRFFVDFLQQYLIRGGFLDGQRGFLMAVVLGQYAFHKYAALWVMDQQDGEKPRS